MDRRSFLSRLGIGAAATVTTQLWLPPVSTAVAQPERRVFVPPRGGWVTGADWASGSDEQVWVWGTNETALDFIGHYSRTETIFDVETYDTLPNEIFQFNPGDTVKVEFGPEQMTGVMVVESIDCYSRTGRTRIRGLGVESFYDSHLNPPLATIKADRGTVTRSLRDGFPGYFR